MESRTLGNLGRVYVFYGKFHKAVQFFLGKQALLAPDTSVERAWIAHDIGRCYLEVGKYEEALAQADAALAMAEGLSDTRWILNASILQAQIGGK